MSQVPESSSSAAPNEVDIVRLFELKNKVGLLATVAVVADVTAELYEDEGIEKSSMLAGDLMKKLRFDTYAGDAVNDLWNALCEALSTRNVQKAKRFQSVAQRAIAAHRKRVNETETELADFTEEVLSGPTKPKDDGEKKDEAEFSWDDVIRERSKEIDNMRKEIDLLAKKGILLALLHRITDTNLTDAMDLASDGQESEAGNSKSGQTT